MGRSLQKEEIAFLLIKIMDDITHHGEDEDKKLRGTIGRSEFSGSVLKSGGNPAVTRQSTVTSGLSNGDIKSSLLIYPPTSMSKGSSVKTGPRSPGLPLLTKSPSLPPAQQQ